MLQNVILIFRIFQAKNSTGQSGGEVAGRMNVNTIVEVSWDPKRRLILFEH